MEHLRVDFLFLMNESGHVMEGQIIGSNNSEFTIDHRS